MLVQLGALTALDPTIVRVVDGWQAPWLAVAGEVLAVLGRADLTLALAVVGAGLAIVRGRRGLALALLCLLPMTAVELASKHVVEVPPESAAILNRPRPRYLPSAAALPVMTVNPPSTFPSGHAARLAFLAGLWLVLEKRRVGEWESGRRRRPHSKPLPGGEGAGTWRPPRLPLSHSPTLPLLLVGLAGLTRVTDGQHLPSEVVGGYLLALAFLRPAIALLGCDRAAA